MAYAAQLTSTGTAEPKISSRWMVLCATQRQSLGRAIRSHEAKVLLKVALPFLLHFHLVQALRLEGLEGLRGPVHGIVVGVLVDISAQGRHAHQPMQCDAGRPHQERHVAMGHSVFQQDTICTHAACWGKPDLCFPEVAGKTRDRGVQQLTLHESLPFDDAHAAAAAAQDTFPCNRDNNIPATFPLLTLCPRPKGREGGLLYSQLSEMKR